MPPRRRAAAAPRPPGLSIAGLPDDLLVRCLSLLTQQERFQHASLVSKRFQQLCQAPQLLRTVTFVVKAADCARRCQSLLEFLTQSGVHMRSLEVDVTDGLSFPTPQRQEEAGALVTACLSACSAAGQVEELSVSGRTPLASVAWLPGLTACRQLRLGYISCPLQLPPSFSRLTALTVADLCGSPIELGTATSLPPALTRLRLFGITGTTLPPKLSSLGALARLDLVCCEYDADGLVVLASLPTLRHLTLDTALIPLPASLSAVTQLERLSVTGCKTADAIAAMQAVLPNLTGLTSLALELIVSQGSLAAIAQLPRLQRLLLKQCMVGDTVAADLQLPPGPWLRSIRWLGLPWPLLDPSADALRAAPQLEYLFSTNIPWVASADDWRAFWQFVATHPPLRCLAFARGEDGEEEESVPMELFNAVLALHHCRPGLQVRNLEEAWGTDEDAGTFYYEMTECADIPSGSGFVEEL